MLQDPRDLYTGILGIGLPWRVTEVELRKEAGELHVMVSYAAESGYRCPECGRRGSRKDGRLRRWRHLDTCQYKTIVTCDVPRVSCAEHGVHQVPVAWAEQRTHFTALFEVSVIDWLKETSIVAVARRMDLSWEEVDGVMTRAVRRGLARRKRERVAHLGVDETSFQKRHEYVTVVVDRTRGRVLYVGDDRKKKTLEAFYKGLEPKELAAIETVAMDMWDPYIQATLKHVPNAGKKICFDKFHVAKHLGEAVDQVRRQEHRTLLKQGDETLKGTRYLWLQNPENMSEERWQDLEELRRSSLKSARAWQLKEVAMGLWGYLRPGWAIKAWRWWIGWAQRCRLEPMRRRARMVKEHLWGIINAIVKRVTNAAGESMNAKIQRVKRMACGYRNRARFRNAIYFHCGDLDLYPAE